VRHPYQRAWLLSNARKAWTYYYRLDQVRPIPLGLGCRACWDHCSQANIRTILASDRGHSLVRIKGKESAGLFDPNTYVDIYIFPGVVCRTWDPSRKTPFSLSHHEIAL